MATQRSLFLSFLLLFGVYFLAHSQARENYLTLGLQVNAMAYSGDLNPDIGTFEMNPMMIRPGLGLSLTQKFSPRFSARLGLLWGRLRGDDFVSADIDDSQAFARYTRNLHFRNDIVELSAVGIYELIPNEKRFYKRPEFTPYFFAGIALFYNNPKAKTPQALGGDWVALAPLRTEGQDKPYSQIQTAIPLGFGFRTRATDRLDISIEVGVRLTFTDYIDDVSGNYADLESLDGELARFMADRSAEETAAVSGQLRDLDRIQAHYGAMIPQKSDDGQVYYRIAGFGAANEIRGGSNNDYYLAAGIHLNYILNIKRYRRK